MMSGGNRAPALVTATLALSLSWSGSALAQTTTGTVATEGAGVQIPEGESRPQKPPTAAEVDAPQNQDQEIEARARDTAYYEQGADSFAADMRALIREKYDEQKDETFIPLDDWLRMFDDGFAEHRRFIEDHGDD